MSDALVLYRREEKVAVITLNRPAKMNALSRELWRDLDAAMVKGDDDPEVSAIALVANGQAFSAGADLAPGEDPIQMLHWGRPSSATTRVNFACGTARSC